MRAAPVVHSQRMSTAAAATAAVVSSRALEARADSCEASSDATLIIMATFATRPHHCSVTFAAMYFLMIAPQRKKQKAHAKMISELKTGDEVMTIGGACGTIANVKEKTFVVKFADGVKIEFIKSAISEKVSGDSDNSQKK